MFGRKNVGKEYEGWLTEERARTVLESLDALELGEVQQAVLETAVRYYQSGKRYDGAVTFLAVSVGTTAKAKALIDQMAIVKEGERRVGLRRLGASRKRT